MGLLNRAEKDLKDFLAAQPTWFQKFVRNDGALTADERRSWLATHPDTTEDMHEAYEKLLQRIPGKWAEYRKQQAKVFLSRFPAGSTGRPRKDALAQKASEMKSAGKSYTQIANALNAEYGPETTTSEAIRKLIKSRKP
jgi:hypothetical protein